MTPRLKTEWSFLVSLLALSLAIFAFNGFVGTTISSPQHLALDLASPPDAPQNWDIQNWTAVRYRALFRFIVRGSWSLVFAPDDAGSFYTVFVAWSFLFFGGAVVAFYLLLRALAFDARTSFVGGLLFLSAAPVLLMYKYPVATREDVLAYFLLTVGLLAALRAHAVWVTLIAIAATLTRETTLILPLAYCIGVPDTWRKKIAVLAIPLLAYLGLRILWGNQSHDLLESARNTLAKPWETLAFLFLVFGALWLPYWLGLGERWRARTHATHAGWRMLTLSGPLVFLAVMGATLLISRAREMRIAFILFPWAIPFALDWFVTRRAQIKTWLVRWQFWCWGAGMFALLASSILYFHFTNPDLMRDYLADFKNGYWLFLGALHLTLTVSISSTLFWQSTNARVFTQE